MATSGNQAENIVFQAQLGTPHVAALKAFQPPGVGRQQAQLLLPLQRLGDGHGPHVERGQVERQQVVQHCRVAAGLHLLPDRGEVVVVALHRFRDFQHEEPACVQRGWHDPFVIGRHHDVQEIRNLNGVDALRFDGEVWLCDQRLEGADMLAIASEERLVSEQEHAVAEVGVEVAGEVLAIGNGHP